MKCEENWETRFNSIELCSFVCEQKVLRLKTEKKMANRENANFPFVSSCTFFVLLLVITHKNLINFRYFRFHFSFFTIVFTISIVSFAQKSDITLMNNTRWVSKETTTLHMALNIILKLARYQSNTKIMDCTKCSLVTATHDMYRKFI